MMLRSALHYEEIDVVNKYKAFAIEIEKSRIDGELKTDIKEFVDKMVSESKGHGDVLVEIISEIEERENA